MRRDRATAEVERLRALIPEEQAAKRPRQREARPYDEYSLKEFLRQESWLWERRRVALSDALARLPAELPRGERDGPLHHWRRGLVGVVQDWAEGSRADAAKLVFGLIKELELEVSAPP